MRIAGYGWRMPHAAAALETAGAAWLTADYILRRLPAASRVAIATACAALMTGNIMVVEYATIAQAYGICILLSASAFRFCIASMDGSWWWAGFSGAAAGGAAASSLLCAPMGPVLFVWLAIRGSWKRTAAYAAGAVVGLGSVILAWGQSPRRFVFDVLRYHVQFRQVDWDGWFLHDLDILTAFVDSVQGLMLVSLVVAGIIATRGRRDLTLCAWLVAFSSAYLATTHPTFAQYFIVEMPFAAILAAAGLQELFDRYPRRWPAVLVTALMAATIARSIWNEWDDTSWGELQAVAEEVNRAMTPGARLYAEEQIYLLAGRIPPAGMEWNSGHKVELPLDEARYYHVLPQSELDRQIKHGDFGVLETCEENLESRLDLGSVYGSKKKVGDCFVFQGLKPADPKSTLQ